ncbi:hypothetical protein ACI2OX_10655 [Bacillus sp. N9]
MKDQEYHYLELPCKIKRVFEKEGMRYASIQFIDNQKYEQQIIRFCFEKQVEYRKKG